jgi:hypothetical protein
MSKTRDFIDPLQDAKPVEPRGFSTQWPRKFPERRLHSGRWRSKVFGFGERAFHRRHGEAWRARSKSLRGGSLWRRRYPSIQPSLDATFVLQQCNRSRSRFHDNRQMVGRKDNGILVTSTYGHLRAGHVAAMAKRVTFDAAAEPWIGRL